MNPRPIETARDADLRLSGSALQRAAQSARAFALQTGTAIVISHRGVVQTLTPQAPGWQPAEAVQELPAPYQGKP
ncbi:hypothetical protein [Accumulibacter sp.]|uniref:hypothetical protein n=1 Tax=Accumulibacter sp. TaxID=2053492 RepID=UPI0025EB7C43|nr:hypothetical protein [Accumulibacter sp.]MCM8613492.1 hypothetical protein [Accumulibacter sp.]MCM8637193.1 hypothetical protein [Accumulibacter sp.]MCM8640743.1 hypothetical protein [Accumulibacter sp.]